MAIALNTYRAGTAVYTNVITQQTLLLGNQETALTVQEQRLVASVASIQALGGGFDQAGLPIDPPTATASLCKVSLAAYLRRLCWAPVQNQGLSQRSPS